MIAADTSTWVAFLEGGAGEDAQLLDKALEDRQVVMVPVVLTELLSDPKLPTGVAETLSEVPLIEIGSGYWKRAGELRAKVLAKRRKAHARPGLSSVRRSCAPRSCTWVVNGLTGPRPVTRASTSVSWSAFAVRVLSSQVISTTCTTIGSPAPAQLQLQPLRAGRRTEVGVIPVSCEL